MAYDNALSAGKMAARIYKMLAGYAGRPYRGGKMHIGNLKYADRNILNAKNGSMENVLLGIMLL